MKTSKEDIGGRVKEIRSRLGILQKDLGARIGVGKQAVSHYESGTAYPSPETLALIAGIGNVSLDWLITGKENKLVPEISREDALRSALLQALKGDTKFALQVCEEMAGYGGKELGNDERQLLTLFAKLGQAEREKVIEIARLYAGEKEG